MNVRRRKRRNGRRRSNRRMRSVRRRNIRRKNGCRWSNCRKSGCWRKTRMSGIRRNSLLRKKNSWLRKNCSYMKENFPLRWTSRCSCKLRNCSLRMNCPLKRSRCGKRNCCFLRLWSRSLWLLSRCFWTR